MSKNKSTKRGPVAQLVVGTTLIGGAAAVAVLSQMFGFVADVVAWPVFGVAALAGIVIDSVGGHRLRNAKKASKLAENEKQNTDVKSEELVQELEEGLQNNKVEVKEILNQKYSEIKFTSNVEKNTFVVYEPDGKTVKILNGQNMIYKITSDEHYGRQLRGYLFDYLRSTESGDCVVEVFGPDAKTDEQGKLKGRSFSFIGDDYKSQFGKLVSYVQNVSANIRDSEFIYNA